MFFLISIFYFILEKLLLYNATGSVLVGRDAYHYYNMGRQYLNGSINLGVHNYALVFNVLVNSFLIWVLGESPFLVISFKTLLDIIIIGIPLVYMVELYIKRKRSFLFGFMFLFNPYLLLVLSRNWKDTYVIFGIILICISLFCNRCRIRKQGFINWKYKKLFIIGLLFISVIRIHVTIIILGALFLAFLKFKKYNNFKLLVIMVLFFICTFSFAPSFLTFKFLHNRGPAADYISELQVTNYNEWQNKDLINKFKLVSLRWIKGIERAILIPNPIKIWFDYFNDYSALHDEVKNAKLIPKDFIYQTLLAILSTSIYMIIRYLIIWPLFFKLCSFKYKKNWFQSFGIICFLGIQSIYAIKFMFTDPRYFLMPDLFLLLAVYSISELKVFYYRKFQFVMFLIMILFWFLTTLLDASILS